MEATLCAPTEMQHLHQGTVAAPRAPDRDARDGRIGILLINRGSPQSQDFWSVRRYRGEFLSDPRAVECLIPAFDGAIFSLEWKEAPWDRFFMAAPRRLRQSVEQYKIVKRA